jgi:hypothetical protein
MGFTEDSMHSYVERDLKKEFSPREGWIIERNPEWDGTSFQYQVSRKKFGQMKRYVVDVLIKTKVEAEEVRKIQEKLSSITDNGVQVDRMILIVPSGADISGVPDDLEIKYLKILKVEEGDILWWRKNPIH